MSRTPLLLLSAVLLVAGCTAPATVPLKTDGADDVLKGAITLMDKKGFRIDQPVDVYLVGFDVGTAAQLQDKLPPEEVYGAASDAVVNFPPSAEGTLGGPLLPLPTIPRALYRVHELPAEFATATFQAVAAAKLEGGSFDANLLEDRLAETLLPERRSWDPNRPALVILHGRDQLPPEHVLRYTYPSGHLEPVRAFGERHPFLAYDVSAKPDPYVTENRLSPEGVFFRTVFGDNPVKPYNFPLATGGDDVVQHLADLTIDATHYRLLQPALYPISTKPCHHVTLVLGIHATSSEELADLRRDARSLADVPAIETAFENLTGDDVQVDLNVLLLPVDDPVLDAFMRTAANGALIVFPFMDAMRHYLDENWEQYVTPVAGCEEYLSLFLFGDLATKADFGGMGTYDVTADRRISFSIWPELNRLRATWDGPAKDVVGTNAPSQDPWNRLNVLYAHETGHIFGQHHPQHLQHAEAESPQLDTFQSVWSVMSYETDWRVHDFGDVDTANWQRNRAGYAVQEAQLLDLAATPEFALATQAVQEFRWGEAHTALEPLIQGSAPGTAYRGIDAHPHAHLLASLE